MGYGRKGHSVPRRIVVAKPSLPIRKVHRVKRSDPKFLTNDVWEGKRCFILGGGPSLENFNYRCLDTELTIGINKTFMSYFPTINYSMDHGFFLSLTGPPNGEIDQKEMQAKWRKYKGLKVFASKGPQQDEELGRSFVVHKSPEKRLVYDLQSPMFLGSNSGFGALVIAIALGANPIYLLGYDMCVDEARDKTHSHKGYVKHNIRSVAVVLKEYLKEFQEYAKEFRKIKVSIVNVASRSKLDCFDTLPITALPSILSSPQEG